MTVEDVLQDATRLPDVCLVVLMSGGQGAPRSVVDCTAGEVTIGRSEDASLLVQDDKVSRRHARVVKRADAWRIIDEESLNGVFCNDARVEGERILEDGDRIRVGRTVMVFLCGEHVSRDDVWNSMREGAALPFPLAILRLLVASRPTPLARVRASIDAIDTALRFTFGVLTALLDPPDEALAALREALSTAPRWGSALRRLTELAQASPLSDVAEALRAARVDWDGSSIPLHEAITQADALRAEITSDRLDSQAFAREGGWFFDLVSALLLALRPFASRSLVSLDQIESFDSEPLIRYSLLEHRGAYEIVRVMSLTTEEKLKREWCYLREASGSMRSLAPFVRYGLCAVCRRRELGLVEMFVIGRSGLLARTRSITTDHRTDVPVSKEWETRILAMMNRFGDVPVRAAKAPVSPRPVVDLDKTNPDQAAFNPPVLLFLSASPRDLPDIDPSAERTIIEAALFRGADGNGTRSIKLITKDGLQARELQSTLGAIGADIVHVSAHGSTKGEIYLLEGSSPIAVEPEDLAAALAAVDPDKRPRVLVLSACFSAKGVELLAPHVGCIIGMTHQISVEHALDFASQLYESLAAGDTVARAFARGKAQIGIVTDGDASDVWVPQIVTGLRDPAGFRIVRSRSKTMDERG